MFARTVACIVCLLCSLAGAERWSTSQAPGDADSSCLPGGAFGSLHPTYPPNMRPLMDSRSYEILLPPQENPIWTRVDNDTSNSATSFTEVSKYIALLGELDLVSLRNYSGHNRSVIDVEEPCYRVALTLVLKTTG